MQPCSTGSSSTCCWQAYCCQAGRQRDTPLEVKGQHRHAELCWGPPCCCRSCRAVQELWLVKGVCVVRGFGITSELVFAGFTWHSWHFEGRTWLKGMLCGCVVAPLGQRALVCLAIHAGCGLMQQHQFPAGCLLPHHCVADCIWTRI